MELKVMDLVSREEIPVPALPEERWDLLAAGGRTLLLGRTGGAAAGLRLLPDGTACEAFPLPETGPGLRGLSVSSLGGDVFAFWNDRGVVTFVSPEGSEEVSFPAGIRSAALGSVQAVLTEDGLLHYRRKSGRYSGGWRRADWENVRAAASGPYRLCVLDQGGTVRFLETDRDPAGACAERGPGAGSAVCDGYGGIYTLRNGKLCRNGRICVTGCDVSEIRCAVSGDLEFAVCRRRDGTFLTALMTGTYTPSSLPFPDAERVSLWDAGDRFFACLSE